jgi:hypothetical protein
MAEGNFLEKSRDLIKEDLKFSPEFYADEYNIDGARTKKLADKMSELIEKWNGLVGIIEAADQLAELYWN